MEEIIKQCNSYYKDFYFIKIYYDKTVSVFDSEGSCIDKYESLEELRNHLNS